MKTLKIAIAGASGFVGRYLVPYLLKQGHQVLGLTRSPRKEQTHENFSWVACDLFSYKDIKEALQGCDVAYYMAHSMLPTDKLAQGNFSDYDLALADNFSRAAKINGLKQILYLGGIIPDDTSLSPHLLSRLEVERTLRASGVPLTSLRAGIILGPEGSSFRMMYNLVKRLPLMVCPSWTQTLSAPIYIDDVVKLLGHSLGKEAVFKKSFDIGGKTTLSYIEMMRTLSEKMGKKNFFLEVPLFSPGLSKLWVSTFSGAPKSLVYPLIASLKTHMVPNKNRQLDVPDCQPLSYEESLELILKNQCKFKEAPRAFKKSGKHNVPKVRSIQRLETLYRMNAEEVSQKYFHWLDRYFPFIKVKKEENRIGLYWFLSKKPLISFEHAKERSSKDFQLFYIRQGLVTKGEGRGRLVFRTIIDNRYTMMEVHEFIPSLPWYIYKYSQALLHLLVAKLFNKYLLRTKVK